MKHYQKLDHLNLGLNIEYLIIFNTSSETGKKAELVTNAIFFMTAKDDLPFITTEKEESLLVLFIDHLQEKQ